MNLSCFTGLPCSPLPRWRWLSSTCLMCFVSLSVNASEAPPLSLNEALQYALQNDPQLMARTARSEALAESAVADGQLPDPKLRFGAYNVPLDSGSFSQEPSTQVRFGIQQAFLPGDTLHYRQRKTQWQSKEQQHRAEVAALMTTRNVREQYLERFYQLQAGRVINDTREFFSELLKISERHYASGKVNQQDVLRAQLELSRLDDKYERILSADDVARAKLSQWIGPLAERPLPAEMPLLPKLPSLETLQEKVKDHPAIVAENARIESFREQTHIAREQYKPGWSAGVEYRKRFGDNNDGSSRTDMAAVMLTMDLPLFTKGRQDRRQAASLRQTDAADLSREDKLRELRSQLERNYAQWQRLAARNKLYKERLLPDAHANSKASINAYQAGVGDFTTLMRASISELDARLQTLRVQVDQAKAQARLLYIAHSSRTKMEQKP
ncbi:MAG: TolC family protein [gamma proteobacterium symbiont of Bathyaustriella thionipta]|nr:TolC family protein [gamma proteobacterium symbiont of Bathyaustriella thionipta]